MEEQGIRHVDVQKMILNGQTFANVLYVEHKQVLSSEIQSSKLAPFYIERFTADDAGIHYYTGTGKLSYVSLCTPYSWISSIQPQLQM